jgi:hypothetical protein
MAKYTYKPTTLDDLAAMTNGRSSDMQKQLDGVKDTMKDMAEGLNATHEDVHYLRRSVDILVRSDAAQDAALKTLTARVARLFGVSCFGPFTNPPQGGASHGEYCSGGR